jgi:tetratricopeptide (TPR) repeat protein
MREILKLVETQSGPEHPDSATVRINLAAAYVQVGRYQEAVPLLSSGLRIIEAKLGNRHPTALSAKSGLAGAYFGLGRYAEMIDLLSDVAREAEDQKGPDHPDTLTAWATLGQGYLQTMRFAEAVDLLERVTKRSVARLGSDHPLTLQGLTHLAGGYHGLGRVDEAVEMLRDVVGRGEARWGSDHPRTLGAVHGLAHALEVSRPAEAESHFHRALLGFQKLEGSNGPIVLDLSNDLANVLTRLKRYGEAEPYLRQMLVRDRSRFGPRSPQTSLRLAQIGMVLLFQEKWREAESTLRECLSIREVGEPNAWNTFNTRSQLGASLLAQSRHTEAEPLIVGGYEGLKAREKTIPPLARIRLVESAARVVKLYESWGKPEAAANWRKQLMPDLSDLDAGFPMNPFVTP